MGEGVGGGDFDTTMKDPHPLAMLGTWAESQQFSNSSSSSMNNVVRHCRTTISDAKSSQKSIGRVVGVPKSIQRAEKVDFPHLQRKFVKLYQYTEHQMDSSEVRTEDFRRNESKQQRFR